jgi:hypothetical protein
MKKLTVAIDSKDIGAFPFGLRFAVLWKKRMRDSIAKAVELFNALAVCV